MEFSSDLSDFDKVLNKSLGNFYSLKKIRIKNAKTIQKIHN